MRRRRIRRKRQDSAKAAIRDAAAALFADKGYTATSTREICERAGITKPVLYYHYGNKAQLYEALFLDAFNEYQQEMRRALLRGKTPREKLVELLTAMFGYARHKHHYWRIGFRMVFASERQSPEIDYVEMSRADEKLLTGIVREAIRQGQMHGKPKQIAGAIVGQATSCIMGYLVTGEPRLDRSTAKGIVDMLLKGCGANSTRR